MSLCRMRAGKQAWGMQREKEREKERKNRGREYAQKERERCRLASQFPAARYIYEAHKVAGTAAYIAA